MTAIPKGTAKAIARELRGTSQAEELVDWAVSALASGFDTTALRQLAGLDLGKRALEVNVFEASQMFKKAVLELGLQLPTLEDALRDYARDLACEVVDGNIQPIDAIEIIHREIVGPLNHPADLMPWCYLWEGLDPQGSRSLEPDEIPAAALSVAASFLASEK